MKAQIRMIIASVIVIALALTAVSGITYSWFSDTENANVVVNTATIDINGVYGDPTVTQTTSTEAENLDTTAALSTDKKTLTIENFMANRTITADYTLTNKSTVATTYRMYIAVDGITDGLANSLIGMVAGGGNSMTINSISFENGIAYVVGGANTGVDLAKASDSSTGDSYAFKLSIISDTAMTSNPDFTVKIVNEAYQRDYTYTAAQVIKSGSVSFPTGEATGDVTFKGTAPVAEGATTAQEAEAEIVFSKEAANAATSSGSNEVTLNVEMLEPETSVAKMKLTLDGASTTDFGTDNYVTVTVKITGYYTDVSVEYEGTGDDPILLACVYDSDKNVTAITFKTNHFSQFNIDGTIGVSTIDELKSALVTGGSIILMSDLQSVSEIVTVSVDTTLNLNGHVIKFVDDEAYIHNTSKLKIDGKTNGSAMEGVESIIFTTGDDAELTINGGTYTSTNTTVYAGGFVKQDNGSYKLVNGGTVIIESGKFTATEAEADTFNFYVTGTDLQINDGEFYSQYQACIYALSSKVSIAGGNFSTSGYIIDMPSNDEITISGGTFVGVADEYDVSLLHFGSGAKATVTGGSFSVEAKSKNAQLFYLGTNSEISVTGGDFTVTSAEGATGDSIFVKVSYGHDGKVFSGGTFNQDPSEYLVDGYEATENTETGIWTVTAEA